MSLFSVYYVFPLIAVSVRFIAILGMHDLKSETLAENERINTLVGLQSLDWGDFAKPKIDVETLRSMQSYALDDLVKEAYAGLQCSYLYFAMLHMHIIETYMSDPTNLTNLWDEETASIICTEESATILALVHDQGWKDISSVMWIFHMFAQKTADYFHSFRIQLHVFNERSVVYAYNSVKVLLEEFSTANGCKAYDSANGTLEAHAYTDKLNTIVIGGRGSAGLKALDNKKRFWRQTEHNAQRGWVARDTGRFTLDHLLMDNLLDNASVMNDLLAFGLQLGWQSVVTLVRISHDKAINGTIFLSDYIRALGQFQSEYIRMLGNVAIQVVVKELLRLELKMSTMSIGSWTLYAYKNCNDIGKEIANQVTRFAKHVSLVDDQIFSRVMGSTDRRALYLSCHVKNRVFNLLMYLKDMYPYVDFGVDFRKPMEHVTREYITQSTNAILEISRKNQLNIIENVDNPVLVQVFVEYIKKITSAIDFDIIDSFKQLTASSVFGRLAEMEKEEMNKELQKQRLGVASGPMFDRGTRQ